MKFECCVVPDSISIPDADNFIKNDEICIGSWCIFSFYQVDEEMQPVRIGLVLEFKYLTGKTFKEREYSKLSAPIQSVGAKNIGVLCNFYSFENNGLLSSLTEGSDGGKHKFINIDTYVGSIKEPIYVNKMLAISPELVIELKKLTEE